jgi:uncharacterized protein YbaP (TraB family)
MIRPALRSRLRLALALCALLAAQAFALDPGARLPLWEIRSDSATAYLFGTVHVGRQDFYPLPAAVEKAYRSSQAVALEIDSTDVQALSAAVAVAIYQPPDVLDKHLPAPLLERLKGAMARIGVDYAQVQRMKPFMAMLMLTSAEYSKLGYDATMGLDIHFADRAVPEGKRIVQLESAAAQFGMMDSLSPGLQEELLAITLDEIEAGKVSSLVKEMLSAWTVADLGRLQRVLTEEERKLSPARAREFHEKFLASRNAGMAQKIDSMLKERTAVFIAVGAAHALGEDGLVELLKKKGYRVRQL